LKLTDNAALNRALTVFWTGTFHMNLVSEPHFPEAFGIGIRFPLF